MRIEIRNANPEDFDWLLGQLKQFSKFAGTKLSLFPSDDVAREFLSNAIKDPHLFLIAEAEDIGPVGFIAGLVTPHLFNPVIKVLAETFWWVDEKHRGSRAGAMLLHAFIERGKQIADWITMALEEQSPISEASLTRRGFKRHERAFLMEVL